MKQTTLESYRERMLRAFIYIQANLDEALDLNELAKVAHFSPFHFHRIFKAFTGESVMEHIRRLRLERAALNLRYTSRSVTDLAFDAGYETLESFSRAFRKRFECSPSEYRARRVHPVVPGDSSVIHFTAANIDRDWEPASHGGQHMDVAIKNLGEMPVAFVRHVGPYEQCETAWKTLCGWAGPKGLMGPGSMFIGICYDDPTVTNPDNIRYDACMTVEVPVSPEGEVGTQTIPAGRYAVYRHVGPYSDLLEVYNKLYRDWMPSAGEEPANQPSLEVYIKTPDMVPFDELVTDIYIALA